MSRGNLPSGTVTFLFTDIEGSTRLWESSPELMRVSLARHDALVRQAIEDASGYVFKTVGDAFCAAFATATAAIEAATAAQLALVTEPWPPETPISVRIAIHTGAVETRDNDYFGQPVNRVARLLSVGHGSQILISGVTKAMVASDLPKASVLRYLGSFRLKDIEQPEELWQVHTEGLPSDFPDLRTWADVPTNLTGDLTTFVGRRDMVVNIADLVQKHRLVTLTGTGGGGKSRLATEVARSLMSRFPDGVWLIELAELTDLDDIVRSIQSSLNLPAAAAAQGLTSLVQAIRERNLLLVIDNCEHMLGPVAETVSAILRGSPETRLLMTSREPTGASGEVTRRVPSLELPKEGETNIAALMETESVALFVERAQSQAPHFALTQENAQAIVHICRTLDGIPLALELAAARIRALPPQELAKRLEDRFRLLTGGNRGDRQRHQTLRATIEWSYRMISELEREAFEQLSVFAGGWTLTLAEKICVEPIEDFELLDLLTALVDKSLVNFESATWGRYAYLETIRQFAREQLAARPEMELKVLKSHAEAMAIFGMECYLSFRTPTEPNALQDFVKSTPNIVAALAWAKKSGDLNLAARLTLSWSASLQRRGYQRDGVAPIDEIFAMASTGDLEPELHARLLCERATLALDLLENAAAEPYILKAKEIAKELDSIELSIRAENLLGQVAMAREDFALTRSLYDEALRLSEMAKNWVETARLRNNLGIVERRDPNGDKDLAVHHYRVALDLQRQHGHSRGEAETLNSLGVLEQSRGKLAEAASLYLEAALIETRLEHSFGVAKTLSNYGEALTELGEPAKALKPFGIAEQLFRQVRSPYSEYTSGLLTKAASELGWKPEQIEDFRATCGKVELAQAVTSSLQE